MFKNRSVRITLDKDDNKTPNEHVQMDRDQVIFWNSVIMSNLQMLGGGLVVLYAAKKGIDTASAMLIKMTPSG